MQMGGLRTLFDTIYFPLRSKWSKKNTELALKNTKGAYLLASKQVGSCKMVMGKSFASKGSVHNKYWNWMLFCHKAESLYFCFSISHFLWLFSAHSGAEKEDSIGAFCKFFCNLKWDILGCPVSSQCIAMPKWIWGYNGALTITNLILANTKISLNHFG